MLRLLVILLTVGFAPTAFAQNAEMRPQARPVVDPAYANVRPVARTVVEETDVVAVGELAALEIGQISSKTIPLFGNAISTSDSLPDVTSRVRDPLTGPLAIVALNGPADPSLRPLLRPDGVGPRVQGPPTAAARVTMRPYTQPELASDGWKFRLYRAAQNPFPFSRTAVRNSLRPSVRPAAFVRRAEEQRRAVQRGQVCGDPAIQGEALGNVPGPGQCGVQNGVRVRSIAGVTLTSRAIMDCRTATALKRWVVNGAKPAVGNAGGGLSSIRVIGTYSCRNRNAAATGRLSEHAFGHAIDIAGFGLRDGREISVLRGWNTNGDGAILRRMWRAACGPFGTVLGPNANRFHRDHFHFDTARYRSGSYCR